MMKLVRECVSCVSRVVDQIAQNSGSDPHVRRGLARLKERLAQEGFHPDRCPPWLTTWVLEKACAVTGQSDPYQNFRQEEMEAAEEVFRRIRPVYGDDFQSCVELAVLGNNLDFYRGTGTLEATLAKECGRLLDFSIDHTARAEDALNAIRNGTVLFLADNAGEVFFDIPLVERISSMGIRTCYGVKQKPFINDLTWDDLERSGMLSRIPGVFPTGGGAILDLPSLSEIFRKELKTCDLIISKGQANYECLSELSVGKKIFYLLKAKCRPISQALDVPLDSYVALFKEP